MDKTQKNRSGSQSNGNPRKNEVANDRGRTHQPGAPEKSNRQTGGSKRQERDDSNGGAERNTTKKGPNSI
jgi:hypothetical protein